MANQTREGYDEQRKQWNAKIVQQLKENKLPQNAIVIFVVGPAGAGKTNLVKLITGKDIYVEHELRSGTQNAECVVTKVQKRTVIFVDTPGFGDPDLPTKTVKKKIFSMLGYFTRHLGGVHGILYVQSILDVRPSAGMRECVEFLKEICVPSTNHRITFITTKWDMTSGRHRARCVTQELQMASREWGSFEVAQPGGARSFHVGVSFDDQSDSSLISQERDRLWEGILQFYLNTEDPAYLDMPFLELKLADQFGKGFDIFEKIFDIAIPTIICAGGILALGAAAIIGAEFTFAFTWIIV